jgi:hypothetical protein
VFGGMLKKSEERTAFENMSTNKYVDKFARP